MMCIADIMSSPVQTIGSDEDILLAQSLMQQKHLRHLPVVHDEKQLVGLISHRDLLKAAVSSLCTQQIGRLQEREVRIPVAHVMSRDLWTVPPEMALIDAAEKMVANSIGCLLVTHNRYELKGIVTETDFLKLAWLTEVELEDDRVLAAVQSAAGRSISAIMTHEVDKIKQGARITLAKELMEWQHIRHLPVVDDVGRLVGLLSYRDILAAMLSHNCKASDADQENALGYFDVDDIMHKKLYTGTPKLSLSEAAALMCENKVGCLPIIDNDKLIGIVTAADFVKLLSRSHPSKPQGACG